MTKNEVIGENKERDLEIIQLYLDGYSCGEIHKMRNDDITVRRVEQIIYVNRALVKIDKQYENFQQIQRIKRQIRKAKESKKDVLDWEVLYDKKIGSTKIEHAGNQQIIVVVPQERQANYTKRLDSFKQD